MRAILIMVRHNRWPAGAPARVASAVARTLGLAWISFACAYLLAGMATQLLAGFGWPPVQLMRYAAGMAWGEWFVYQMEWFDVWRHGPPGWRYWLTTVVPVAAAWGTGGAVLGSAIGGRRTGSVTTAAPA